MSTVSQRISSFAAGLRAADLPEEVRTAAVERVVDTVGVALAGSAEQVPAAMASASLAWSPPLPGGASVWGRGQTISPPTAAFLNAASAHSEDFDDTHTAGVVHGSTCVVPAAWAAAEYADADADTLLAGVIAGWEVDARIGLASKGELHRRGWHPTSVAGVFGAAAAAATVLGLSQTETEHALGLAGSGAAGINSYLSNGSSGKLLNPAIAAQNGLVATFMAQAGVTGPDQVLEGRFGVFDAFAAMRPELDADFADLGQRWEILRVSTKPYPACHFSHASIDSVLALRQQGLTAQNAARIRCHIPPETFRLIADPWQAKLNPTTVYGLRFSLPWLGALALVDGEVTRDSFTDATLQRTELHALAQRFEAVAWDDSPYPSTFPGRAEGWTDHGRHLEAEIQVNRGHPDNPLSSEEIARKFIACARARLQQDSAQRLADTLLQMDKDTKVRDLAAAMSPRDDT